MFGEPGQQIAYSFHEGPPGAPVILLVHGFTACRAAFQGNIAGLSRHFTVVSTELLGHGDSDAPEDKLTYSTEATCSRLLGVADELGLERFFLCGHSLGAAVAIRVALDSPERLRGLVMLNSNSAAAPPEWHAKSGPRIAELGERARAEGLAEGFDKIKPHAFAYTGTELSAKVSSFERLHELSVPTLVVAGTGDHAFMSNLPGMLEKLPSNRVRLVNLEGAGHAANLEQPEAFKAAVVDFAAELHSGEAEASNG